MSRSTTKPGQILSATADDLTIGDQVREYPGDPWLTVARRENSVAVIAENQVATVALFDADGESLRLLASAPVEIQRDQPATPTE